MSVTLLPPISRSFGRGVSWERVGPRFVQKQPGAYWHRPRHGQTYRSNPDRICWSMWCGQHAYSGDCVTRDRPPLGDGDRVCGICEGKAVGAGQIGSDTDYATSYIPMGMDPPRWCPGNGDLYREINWRVGTCLVCGETMPLRACGGPYQPSTRLVRHHTGPGLIPRCDWHGWQYLTTHDGRAVCQCETPGMWQP
jgi:hypothetical protein